MASQLGFVPDGYAAVVDADVRVAPDGGTYTRAEFIEFYGGTDEWDAAPGGDAANLNSSYDESYDESYDDFDATAAGSPMPSYPPPNVDVQPHVPSPASHGSPVSSSYSDGPAGDASPSAASHGTAAGPAGGVPSPGMPPPGVEPEAEGETKAAAAGAEGGGHEHKHHDHHKGNGNNDNSNNCITIVSYHFKNTY